MSNYLLSGTPCTSMQPFSHKDGNCQTNYFQNFTFGHYNKGKEISNTFWDTVESIVPFKRVDGSIHARQKGK